MNNNEFNLNNYIKDDFIVSDKLDDTIKLSLNKIHNTKRTVKYIASIVAVFIAYIVLINTSAGFRAFAQGIPGLKDTIKWFYLEGDKTMEAALANEYPDFGGITIEQDGFIVSIDHLIVDDVRMHISSRVYNTNDVEGEHQYEITYDLDGFENLGMYSHIDNGNEYISECDIVLDGNSFINIIKEQGYLMIGIKIYENHNIIADFGTQKVMLDLEKILPSKEYIIDKIYNTTYGELLFEKFIISPTKTELIVTCKGNENYSITGIKELSIMLDNNKTLLTGINNYGTYYLENELTSHIEFNSNLYYDKDIKEIRIFFDGIYIEDTKDNSFILFLDEHFPKTFSYMGEDVIVNRFSHNDFQEELTIMYKLKSDSPLKGVAIKPLINGDITIAGFGGSSSSSGGEYQEIERIANNVAKQEKYTLIFTEARYEIELKDDILIKLK